MQIEEVDDDIMVDTLGSSIGSIIRTEAANKHLNNDNIYSL